MRYLFEIQIASTLAFQYDFSTRGSIYPFFALLCLGPSVPPSKKRDKQTERQRNKDNPSKSQKHHAICKVAS